jgi:hypothetical protein
MSKLMLPAAAIGLLALTGCVGYGGGTYGAGGVYYDNSPYYGSSPYYGTPYGSPYYGYSSGVVIEQRPAYIYGGTRYSRRMRDRDHDGVPNRYDRDRDGDGVSNRRDAYPNDPRRR